MTILWQLPGTRVAGRKLVATELNQHNTDPKLLAHYGRELTNYDYNTIYSDNYRGCQSSQPTICCRSFPRQYQEAQHRPRPDQTGCLPPTSDNGEPCRRTTEILALTQKPFLKNTGSWKYSYHGMPRCYPAGFSHIDSSNPYPGFYLRPWSSDKSKTGPCDAQLRLGQAYTTTPMKRTTFIVTITLTNMARLYQFVTLLHSEMSYRRRQLYSLQ